MSRLRNIPGWAKVAVGLLLLLGAAPACEEDSKTAPEKCGTPPLVIYDIQGGAQGDADANPCVTHVGHAISPPTDGTATGGSSASGGSASKGGSAGKGGSGGSAGKGGSASKGGSAGKGSGGQGGAAGAGAGGA